MRQLKISKSITNRESQSIEKYPSLRELSNPSPPRLRTVGTSVDPFSSIRGTGDTPKLIVSSVSAELLERSFNAIERGALNATPSSRQFPRDTAYERSAELFVNR